MMNEIIKKDMTESNMVQPSKLITQIMRLDCCIKNKSKKITM